MKPYNPPRCANCNHPQSVHETSRGYHPGRCHMHGGCHCTEWRKGQDRSAGQR